MVLRLRSPEASSTDLALSVFGTLPLRAYLFQHDEKQRLYSCPRDIYSEHGFTGIAVGAAFAGLRPVLEFMTFVSSPLCCSCLHFEFMSHHPSHWCLQNFASKQDLLTRVLERCPDQQCPGPFSNSASY